MAIGQKTTTLLKAGQCKHGSKALATSRRDFKSTSYKYCSFCPIGRDKLLLAKFRLDYPNGRAYPFWIEHEYSADAAPSFRLDFDRQDTIERILPALFHVSAEHLQACHIHKPFEHFAHRTRLILAFVPAQPNIH